MDITKKAFVADPSKGNRGTLMDLEQIRSDHWGAPIFLASPRTYGYVSVMFQTTQRFIEVAPGVLQWSSNSFFPLIVMSMEVGDDLIGPRRWPSEWGVR